MNILQSLKPEPRAKCCGGGGLRARDDRDQLLRMIAEFATDAGARFGESDRLYFTAKWRDVPQAVIPLPPYGAIEVTSS